ncbi:RagB/SusD family nutrient uptake outer membrane protein [Chitinophaga sancti]|uniref:RagB/SusD family nutrient uptake outer membrane protein n=1 Tax=Chitinophaga sancti TaxID=1004 RepID=UPI003F78CB17
MKFSIYKSLAVLVIISNLLTACSNQFLEVKPKGSLIAQSVSDYDLLLNNLYVVYINSNTQVPMGDELVAVEPYFSQANYRTQRLFRWNDVIYQNNEDAPEFTQTMRSIYEFNKIINEIDNATDGTLSQKASLKAEARAGRAWSNFLLINYFGLPYNAATTDPGFPIIREADISQKKFVRSTVKEMYDFIIEDLTAAIADLPAQTTSRLRMSRAAAAGILGKVYVFMGDYGKGMTWLNTAISDMSDSKISVGLYDLAKETAAGGVYASGRVPAMTENIEQLLVKQSTSFWSFTSNELVLSPATAALYGTADFRLKFYTSKTAGNVNYPIPGVLRKKSFSAFQFGVVVPDLYLLRAECACRLGNLEAAKADVELLRSKRMNATDALVPDSITAEKINLLKFILDERNREFAVMGYRWFDMRRLSVDPLFSSITYSHTLYNADGTSSTFTLRPERFVLQFPAKIMQQSPGLINNP